LKHEHMPRTWPCNLASSYFESSIICSKFVASSIQHNLKPVREVWDELGSVWHGFKGMIEAGLGVVLAVLREHWSEIEVVLALKVKPAALESSL